jgi:proteic killer suppression protein
MIASFADRRAADLFHGVDAAPGPRLGERTLRVLPRRLDLVNAAHSLEDVRAAGRAGLVALEGSRHGWQSVRISSRWRILFRWSGGAAHDVALARWGGA